MSWESEHPEIIGYVEPTPEQIKAQKSRSIAIALALFAFVAAVMGLMLYKFGYFGR